MGGVLSILRPRTDDRQNEYDAVKWRAGRSNQAARKTSHPTTSQIGRGQSFVGSREDVEHPTLHSSLRVERGSRKVARANCDDGTKGVGNLQAEGLRCGDGER